MLALMLAILSKKKLLRDSQSDLEGVGLLRTLSGFDSSSTMEKISFAWLLEVSMRDEK